MPYRSINKLIEQRLLPGGVVEISCSFTPSFFNCSIILKLEIPDLIFSSTFIFINFEIPFPFNSSKALLSKKKVILLRSNSPLCDYENHEQILNICLIVHFNLNIKKYLFLTLHLKTLESTISFFFGRTSYSLSHFKFSPICELIF